YSEHGLGASPILHDNLLIMPFDGNSPENTQVGWKIPWEAARIFALETDTGKVRWSAKRGPSRLGHVTPNLMETDGAPLLVSAAGDAIQGHNLKTGELLWSAYSKGEGVVPAIVVGDELVYAASGFEASTIRAVRPGGKGDVTKTHIVWEQTRAVPHMPSFIYSKPYLFTIHEKGIAMCLRAETGEVVWQERIGGDYSASPILADGLIYFLSEQGDTTIIKAADKFEVVAKNSIGEFCQASMAASQGQLFIRTQTHLYAIGK
ncbi:MAG: PQQ-binding-like beta-propeller repeat protein, partial [bacterium]|nr:PQQ-binding-like beta-propeller repeat protein [bacterium]